MTRVFAEEVLPVASHVALLDATWQDYPWPDDADEWVTFRADSLIDPDHPPYPGVSVKTRGTGSEADRRVVLVEVWLNEVPPLLTRVFTSQLHVGGHGVVVGNEDSILHPLGIDSGTYEFSVFVDTPDNPRTVSHVAFAVGERV